MRLLKLITLYIYGFCTVTVSGQQVVSSSGKYYQNDFGSIAYTIGEIMIATYSQKEMTLTQGVHQPIAISTKVINLVALDSLISAFPNPASNKVTLKVTIPPNAFLKFILADINAKIFLQKNIVSTQTEIPFDKLPGGVYFIKVYVGATQVKTLKIIKQ